MSISAVIVNYNSWDDTFRILKKLPSDVETIVVDNGSRIRKHVQANKVIYNEKNEGFASALNKGIEIAQGEYILILTPDVDFHKEVIYALKEFLDNNPDVAIAVPSAITPSGKVWPMARRASHPMEFFICGRRSPLSKFFKRCNKRFTYEDTGAKEPIEVEAAVGTLMMLRKKAWEEIGGFDPNLFFYTEDIDISIRLREAGWKIFLLPHYRIIHNVGKIRKAHSFFAESKRTQSFYRFFKKHYRFTRTLKPILFAGAFFHIAQMGFRHLFDIPPKDPHW